MSLMLEEIHQQPQVLERILEQKPRSLSRLRKRFATRPPKVIVLVARGSSDNAALFARYLFEITLGIPTSLAAASVTTLYKVTPRFKDALVVGISQSGESTDVNVYLQQAMLAGAFTVGITNEDEGKIVDLVDEVLFARAGREKSIAATKTYTGQLLMLYLLAGALGAQVPDENLRKIPGLTAQQLCQAARVKELAERSRSMSHAIVLGRGVSYANAREFALKLMETSYVVAAGYSGADFAHGPIAMVQQGFPVFAFRPPGPTGEETTRLLGRLRDSRSEILCIGPPSIVRESPCTRSIELAGEIPQIPGCPPDLFTPIPSIVPAQLFSAYLAEAKGLNPDKPRLLSKITRTL